MLSPRSGHRTPAATSPPASTRAELLRGTCVTTVLEGMDRRSTCVQAFEHAKPLVLRKPRARASCSKYAGKANHGAQNCNEYQSARQHLTTAGTSNALGRSGTDTRGIGPSDLALRRGHYDNDCTRRGCLAHPRRG